MTHEQPINGVLHYLNENDVWTAYSPEELTLKVMELWREAMVQAQDLQEIIRRLESISNKQVASWSGIVRKEVGNG